MTTQRKLFGLILLLILGTAGPLAADMRFELGFGWTLVGPAMNTTYVNQYVPTLTPPDRYIGSSASQTVRVKGKTTYGLNGFFNLMFTDNLGLQILADYHRPGIGGANTNYDVAMSFEAFEPETYSRSSEWPASDGNFTETAFSLNALARFHVASNLSLSVSGGPSVFHMEGKGGYIGYTFFNLAYVDDQYVLSGGTYQMVFEFGSQTTYGMNLGVEAAYEAFRHVILAFDVRWYGSPKRDVPLHIVADEVITQPIDEIEATIGLGTLQINPSYFRAGLAIRFVF
jgi:hypothetical protein